jgi:tetratricopeptide (TPR) repeat protein
MAIALSLSRAAPKEGADWLAKRWAAKKDDRSLQFALGVFQVQNKDYEAGMKNLNTILAQTTGTDDRSRAERITLLRFMSIAAHTQKDLPTARKLYEELLTLDPQNSTITNNLAYLLMTEFKEPAKAQELAETAVRNLSPTAAAQDKAVLFDTLGWCLVSSGNLDAGIARLQQAASMAQGGNASLDYVMAGLYYHMAEGYFRRSQAAGNKNAEFDRTESGVACRRSWHLLKTADPSDPDRIGQSLKDLAGKLKIDLEPAATSPPAKKT